LLNFVVTFVLMCSNITIVEHSHYILILLTTVPATLFTTELLPCFCEFCLRLDCAVMCEIMKHSARRNSNIVTYACQVVNSLNGITNSGY